MTLREIYPSHMLSPVLTALIPESDIPHHNLSLFLRGQSIPYLAPLVI
jgi:hypothetical protein